MDFANREVWFVTGRANPSKGYFQTGCDATGGSAPDLLGSKSCPRVHWADHMDAYILASQNVDCWLERAQQTFCSPSYTI
jgi:hypothetical protein